MASTLYHVTWCDAVLMPTQERCLRVLPVASNNVTPQGSRGRARAMPAVAEAAEKLSREAEDLLNNVFVARRVVSCCCRRAHSGYL